MSQELTTQDFLNEIEGIEKLKQELMLKAMSSNDPNLLVKANEYNYGRVPMKTETNPKSLLQDPLQFASNFRYKDRRMNLSYTMLRRMSATPIVGSIITTRVEQASRFTEYAENKFAIGFKIMMKDTAKKPDKNDLKNIDQITQAVLDCGFGGYTFGRDDFTDFIQKIMRDSLTYDQLTFEVLEDKSGVPREWFATDASSYRIADIEDDEVKTDKNLSIRYYNKRPYEPAFVQLDQTNGIHDYFYPWELCFAVRNPRTDLRTFGYGYSELEDLVDTVTGMLWADEYNRRFFSHGSAPKGIIRVNGLVDPNKLLEFKREWMNQMSGVYNSWKTPIMHADKMDWINLMMSNREMEYRSWLEYNIKLACAKFTISPTEIGFDLKNSEGKAVFESNTEGELKYSLDKGLTPLMVFIESKLNKYIIKRIDPRYKIKFYGISDSDKDVSLDRAIKELGNYKTLDEVRAEMDLEPMGEENGGNMIFNGYFMQYYQQKKQEEQQKEQEEQQQMYGDQQGDDEGDDQQDGQEGDEQEQPQDNKEPDNPFQKAFDKWVDENLYKEKS